MRRSNAAAACPEFERAGKIQLVPMARMHISSRHAQREKFNQGRVDYIHARFDPDKIGHPVLSKRGNDYYIVDGQHRIEAAKKYLGAGCWETQVLECFVYTDLTEAEEAELFLSLNDVMVVNAFDKFRVAVNAGRVDEVEINRVVIAAGLTISRESVAGSISAVTALRRVYTRTDSNTLARVLLIIRESYGDAGFGAIVIDGIGLLCQRYGDKLDTDTAITALSSALAGVNGLLNKADVLRKQTGQSKALCVAAAATEIINAKSDRGRKLASWWTEPVAASPQARQVRRPEAPRADLRDV
jgi:hypothetical protein